MGVKTVSLFGPVSEIVYGPYPQSQEHIVIKEDVSCRPCYRNFRFSKCEHGRICLFNINAEKVFSAVKRLL